METIEMRVEQVVNELKSRNDENSAKLLSGIATEVLNVNEAFDLGRSLQNLLNAEEEFSNTKLNDWEIVDVIEYVKSNIKQSLKY